MTTTQSLHPKFPTKTTMERPRHIKKSFTLLSTLDEDMEDVKQQHQKRLQLQQQQQRWSRKDMTSPPLLTPESNRDEDPFAGMTTGVNYQQEIERLKSIVPKVDSKKSNRRPRSIGSTTTTPIVPMGKMKPIILPSTTTLGRRTSPPVISTSSRLSTTSTETTPSSSPYYDGNSRVTSPSLSTPRSLSPMPSDYTSMTIPPVPEEDEQQCIYIKEELQEDEQQQHSVITEEEKTRFLQFMRHWTGGWKGWEHTNNIHQSNDDGHFSGMESVRNGGSLWAEQLPWTKHPRHHRRCSWQEGTFHSLHDRRPLNMTLTDRKFDISMRSEPCTPLLAPR
ncbi:hypothetical protein BDA99DRAFT_525936 [Phascolomyces articulosus]|uniref:Uncharacterized protein n=1 Tax=Phascolomyces articulosus TaxID=60185 RepID=A0AAD5P8R4_9FUNG|nr:hypothetical protein BDA99DRAFT_525936 [Phascolomyces articulosus]